MKLTGLHILLTYRCTLECDHCFAWGSPYQSGIFTRENLRLVLQQARELGTVESIYFEGGEPFLFYPLLLEGVREAHNQGFEVGIVSNAYWATSPEDAYLWLEPMAGLLEDLSVSSDLFHYSEMISQQARCAQQAAEELGVPLGVISIARPDEGDGASSVGQLPSGESGVMYRGRAVQNLAPRAPHQDWESFTTCPHEDLRDPGRLHLDPFGYLHICQGIGIGNLFETPLAEIVAAYQPEEHPIAGPLLHGGPAALVHQYQLSHEPAYADACHLCYTARLSLRKRFPHILAPDSMYGVPS